MPAPLRETPAEAVELIKSFEGLPDGDPGTVNLDAYLDPLGIWTIGWGHAVVHEGRQLKGAQNKAVARRLYPGGITVAQAETLLRADLLERSAGLLQLVKVPLADGQFGALMSFVFNCGLANFAASTLLRLLNARNHVAAADQFLLWNKGRKNGVLVELPGLTRRRRAERAMFLGHDWRAEGGLPVPRGVPGAARAARAMPADAKLRRPAPERPVAPSAALQRQAAAASAESVRLAQAPAKKTAKKTARRARTAKTARTARTARTAPEAAPKTGGKVPATRPRGTAKKAVKRALRKAPKPAMP
ncbi:MAG TPA: lysozyme [Rubrivivax sp.]|nr:lysozyme [Rubrivivax sp.]HPP82575.1 lysozyme [Rubrivivax sp.]